MSVRQDLAAAIRGVLPTNIKVIDVPRSVDALETKRPVVVIYRDKVEKAANKQGAYLNTFSAWIISPPSVGNQAENQLEDALDTFLEAIDGVLWAVWTTAERSTFGDQMAPAYKVDLTIVSTTS